MSMAMAVILVALGGGLLGVALILVAFWVEQQLRKEAKYGDPR